MRPTIRWFVVVVLAIDCAVAGALLLGAFPSSPAHAEGASAEAETSGDDRDALRLLGLELAERTAELDRREAELEELLRSDEVVARRSRLESPAAAGVAEDEAEAPDRRASEAFLALQRAYENMEPESAAKTLVELAARDEGAVVELLLGWPPRTSGAILDALTQTDAALAAELSYEVWKRSGNVAAPAASPRP